MTTETAHMPKPSYRSSKTIAVVCGVICVLMLVLSVKTVLKERRKIASAQPSFTSFAVVKKGWSENTFISITDESVLSSELIAKVKNLSPSNSRITNRAGDITLIYLRMLRALSSGNLGDYKLFRFPTGAVVEIPSTRGVLLSLISEFTSTAERKTGGDASKLLETIWSMKTEDGLIKRPGATPAEASTNKDKRPICISCLEGYALATTRVILFDQAPAVEYFSDLLHNDPNLGVTSTQGIFDAEPGMEKLKGDYMFIGGVIRERSGFCYPLYLLCVWDSDRKEFIPERLISPIANGDGSIFIF